MVTTGDGRRTDGGARSPEAESLLVQRAFAGDARAFEAVVLRYQKPVLGLANRYLRRAADAEDAAQDAFLRAFVHRERFDPARPLLPWLLTLARSACIDRLRRGRREEPGERDAESCADPGPTAEDSLGNRESLRRLAAALLELPEEQREAVAMFHLDGLGYREIADALEVPIGTVMTWLHRGRARLRALVSGGDGHGS